MPDLGEFGKALMVVMLGLSIVLTADILIERFQRRNLLQWDPPA